tara:strand:- start:875 stop:1078 length:204 start_codon:yes stop_codon:yes gene_type:complete
MIAMFRVKDSYLFEGANFSIEKVSSNRLSYMKDLKQKKPPVATERFLIFFVIPSGLDRGRLAVRPTA